MAATYGFVKEQEIKSVIWFDADVEGAVPTPIAMFPPTIPDEAIVAVCKVLAEMDPEGNYAKETDKFIEDSMGPRDLDDVLREVSIESPESSSEPTTGDQPSVPIQVSTETGATDNGISNGSIGETTPDNSGVQG